MYQKDANIELEGKELLSVASDRVRKELQILIDADAFAFFDSTIPLFIEFKATKNSKEWIWERVCTNVKRLRPYLRPHAKKQILALPNEIKEKMAFDAKFLDDIIDKKK